MKPLTYRQRLGLLALFCACGAFLIVSRLLVLQVTDHDEWVTQAEHLRSGWRAVRAKRGAILDADGQLLAHDAAGFELAVRPLCWRARRYECGHCSAEHFAAEDDPPERCRRCRRRTVVLADERDLTHVAEMLKMPRAELAARIEARVVDVEQHVEKLLKGLKGRKRDVQRREFWYDWGRRAARIQRDVPYEVAREIALHPRRNPAFVIQTSHSRVYPGGAAFAHILGRMRDGEPGVVFREDGGERKLARRVGASGIESDFEDRLAGTPGWVEVERDPRVRSRKILDERPAQLGADLRLTIRRSDQERALHALHQVEGAFVVIDASTGAVLALATAPSYRPEDYVPTLKEWQDRSKRFGIKELHGSPLLERAFRHQQIPGSVMKPFTAIAAMLSGDGDFHEILTCAREFHYRGVQAMGRLRCHALHGELDMHRALSASCNVYFQTLLARMLEQGRFDQFAELGARFGFGRPTGLEIGPDWDGRGWDFRDAKQPGTLIASAIGQGWVLASPTQMARAYAGLATGSLPDLRLLQESPVRRTPLNLPAEILDRVRTALRDVPRPGGSAPDSGLARWDMGCKTGTAQRGTDDNNAWMAGFADARAGRPPIAFAMVILRSRVPGAVACGGRLREFFRYFYAEAQ